MIKQLLSILTVVLTFIPHLINAQTHALEGFSNFKKSAISPIYNGSEVKGYFMFYRSDKADKKNDNFGIDVFSEDLVKVKSMVFQKPRYNSYYPLRNAYNGSAFVLYSFNNQAKAFELETYDKNLQKLGSKIIKDLTKVDKLLMTQEVQYPGNNESNSFTGLNIYPVANKGFIRNDYTGMMKGYTLTMFDNQLNQVWHIASDENSKEYETLLVNEVTEKYLMATVARRDGMMSKKMNFSIVVFDLETGKKILDKPVEMNDQENLSLSSINFDEQKQEFLTVGEFYKADDKPFVNKSQGFYIKRFSTDGQEKESKFYNWAKEINPLMPSAAKESLEKGYVNYIHKVSRGADGKLYLVAEQYRIAASGGGIALAMMGAGTSVAKGVIGNIFTFVLDADLALKQIQFFEKDASECSLPAGSGFMGAGLLGHVIKMTGGFDYQFLQKSNDASSLHVAYFNYDKVKGNDTKKVLNNFFFGSHSNFTTDKLDISTSKTSNSYVYPGKIGYVMIVDNNVVNKETKIGMRLVKLNQ